MFRYVPNHKRRPPPQAVALRGSSSWHWCWHWVSWNVLHVPSAGRATGSPNRLMSWQPQQVPVVPGDSPTSNRRSVRCRSRGYKVVGARACFWTASRNLNWTTVIKVPRTIHPPNSNSALRPRPRTTATSTTLCSQFSRFHEVPVVPSCAMAGTPSDRHHKPRRKLKQNGDGKGFQLSKAETLVRAPSFPLSAFLWPARGSVSQWEVLPLILMVVGLFRWAAGLWGYSGEH